MTLKEKFKDIIFNYDYTSNTMTESSSQCEQVAEEFAIGFGEWLIKWRVEFVDDTVVGALYNYGGMNKTYTMKELLEIYKKEKGLWQN
jgi:hypothetical protein